VTWPVVEPSGMTTVAGAPTVSRLVASETTVTGRPFSPAAAESFTSTVAGRPTPTRAVFTSVSVIQGWEAVSVTVAVAVAVPSETVSVTT